MIQGEGDRLAREYFRLIEEILESRGLSGREVSRRLGRSLPYFSRVKNRKQLKKSWQVVEKGLGLSPRTLFAVLSEDIEYDQILAAFGPQDEPQEPELVAEFGKLEELIASSPDCRKGEVRDETWKTLEDLERRRFKDARKVEAECRRIIVDALSQEELRRDEGVVAVGAVGVWSTIRRHANDRGSATQGLVLSIRAASLLGIERLSARLLQRACYLLGDVDQFGASELVARKAVELYSDIQDIEGLGMALIDTGNAAYGARELEKAESRLLLGAELLGSKPLHHINKAAAYHLAARVCCIRGQLTTASLYLDKASKYAFSYEKEWAAIRWCAGNIQLQLGQLSDAEDALREALQIYLRTEEIADIVMLLLDLATVLIAAERVEEIPLLAKHLRPYVEQLSEREQVRSHIEEAHACLVRARHVQALQRFKEQYGKAWRKGFATP